MQVVICRGLHPRGPAVCRPPHAAGYAPGQDDRLIGNVDSKGTRAPSNIERPPGRPAGCHRPVGATDLRQLFPGRESRRELQFPPPDITGDLPRCGIPESHPFKTGRGAGIVLLVCQSRHCRNLGALPLPTRQECRNEHQARHDESRCRPQPRYMLPHASLLTDS